MDRKVLAIVVTYNRCELLLENIQALMEQTHSCDILVVDNNSTDGTGDKIKDYIDKDNMNYINTERNIGGAGGFSIGMRYALENGYQYAWLMDDDTVPDKTALDILVRKACNLNDEFSFLSSRVNWTDGKLCEMNLQILPEVINDKFSYVSEGIVPIERASFVSFFVNCDVARKVGLPIKEFFIYGDDWEYSLRMNKELPAYYVYDSVVVHKMKKNLGAGVIVCESSRIDRCYYNIRNTCYIEKRYFSKNHFTKYKLHLIKSLVDILRHSSDSKVKRCRVVIKGLMDGLRFNPDIEYCDIQ